MTQTQKTETVDESWGRLGAKFVQVLIGSFPSQVTAWGEEAIAAYCLELSKRGIFPAEAAKAVRKLTGDFPPSAGNLAHAVERERQGPPPDFMKAHRIIASKIGMLDYFRPAKGFDVMVAALAEEHEAIARFAVAMGPRGLKEMPDPRYAQESGGSVATTRNEKAYRQAAKEWEAEPTLGLALGEAKRVAIGGSGSGGMAALVEGLRPDRKELEAGDD